MNRFIVISLLVVLCSCTIKDKIPDSSPALYSEHHRPQLHFSPKEKWMNDPNGMVYYDGEYHLFYQHYPEGDVWGPMHWGHAITKDLVHWEHLPIALYPDSLGMIFSGSAVVDVKNTSGLGTEQDPAMVAIFTYHDAKGEKQGRTNYQTQGMAYSLDKGRTWTKYRNNPVVKNPGSKDFRDPKVFWHEASGKWVMILAVLDHVEFYGSPDLKTWNKLGEFGKEYGSHGGVWECPDLFQLAVEGESTQKWVMLLSINPGGPNGGSATQYFVGDFDGKKFTSETAKQDTLWLDYGADNYAGVTWSGIPKEDGRRLFLGWMSNWAYANVVPTAPWRSAMTIPRELKLEQVNSTLRVKSVPVKELDKNVTAHKTFSHLIINDSLDLSEQVDFPLSLSSLSGTMGVNDFVFELSNHDNQSVRIGFDSKMNRYFVDRRKSGKTDFSAGFNPVSYAPRLSTDRKIKFTFVVDVSAVEVFFDDGISVLTNLYFPDEDFHHLKVFAPDGPVEIEELEIRQLLPVWK